MPKNRQTILLVEDEPSLINLYREVFKKQYAILVADNLDAARTALQKQTPNIILLDLLIPVKTKRIVDYAKRTGFELLKDVRKNNATKNIPVIILTNLDNIEDRKTAEKLKATDFIVKANILPNQLIEKIANCLS